MIVDQSYMKMSATGLHGQECAHEACLSPSLGWLSPTRISFSKDLSPHELEARGTVDSICSKATTNDALQYKKKERPSSDVRDSMSEFEFSMAALDCDENSSAGNKHMLAADELFFKGKLLPLYVPQFTSRTMELSAPAHSQPEHGNRRSGFDKKAMSSAPASPYSGLKYGAYALMNAKAKEGTVLPTSPKTPRCSTKLRELLGLKRSKPPASVSSATASIPSQDGVPSSLGSCKASSRSANKIRSAAMEAKSPLQTLCKAKRLFFRSDEGMDKMTEARSSTSEPLLINTSGSIDSFSGQSIGCPVISFRPQHQAHHQQFYSKKTHAYVAHNPSLCSSACNQIVRMQRSNRVSDHVEDLSSTSAPFLSLPQKLRVPKEMKNNENHVNARSSALSRKPPMKEDQKTSSLYGGSRRATMQAIGYYLASGETSPARRSTGTMSPAGSSGHWSPGRHSAGALLSGYNTACSSCRGSPGRHSISGATGCYSPGRLSLGAEPLPAASVMQAMHGRLMRARSLERSSSYSPKSLQRKYDQMKAMRQRDAWRPGLERSSSHNNLSSVHVAPVLNVPRVCSINRSSRNSAVGHTHSGSNTNNGGGFGLGHLLFPTKSHSSSSSSYRAPVAKLQQLRQPKLSCGRRDCSH